LSAGHAPRPIERAAEEVDARLVGGIRILREREAEREDALGTKTGIDRE